MGDLEWARIREITSRVIKASAWAAGNQADPEFEVGLASFSSINTAGEITRIL